MKDIIEDILKKRKINKVYFVACGGSLAAFYPAKYFLEKESKTLARVGWYPANEFVHDIPSAIDSQSLVIICSHQGTTPETIQAGRVAKTAGAEVMVFTYVPDSEITTISPYVTTYSWGEQQIYSEKKEAKGLLFAMELLHHLENWQNYKAAKNAFKLYDQLVISAKNMCESAAEDFAKACKNEHVIYTTGCAASWGSACMESICILMEMQWINSSAIHSGEFFHGPLEITDKNVPFLLFMGDGPCRELDERLLDFLERYTEKIYKLDARTLGIGKIEESVREYFCPLLLNAVVDVYNHKLAETRQHPLSMRRYMWKVKY